MIIAVDPGKTTGLVLVEENTLEVFHSCELDQEELIEMMKHLAAVYRSATFVIEEWRNHSRFGDWAWAAEGIGIVKALIPELDKLVIQTPSQAKQSWSDERLKEHGYEITGHARDALRHALYYIESVFGDINTAEPI